MEQRLIDANPIFDKVEANYRMSEGVQHKCEREFLNLLCDAPTVDAVPVVRCGECKHRKQPTGYCEKLLKAYVPDDFYCFYGKQKDGAE